VAIWTEAPLIQLIIEDKKVIGVVKLTSRGPFLNFANFSALGS
jgi:hypothetical protein